MIKNFIINILTSKPFRPFWRTFDPSCGGMVLMFHRVHPRKDRGILKNDKLNVSPEYLDELIRSFRKEGYAFLSPDELLECYSSHREHRKVLCLTFDDGYHEFMEHALPVLEEHGVPAAIFVNTGAVKRESFYWWLLLEDAVLENEVLLLPEIGTFPCRTAGQKNESFWRIRNLLLYVYPDAEKMTSIFEKYLPFDLAPYYAKALHFEDIRALSCNKLITLGNHTHNHISCAQMTFETVKQDIRKCQETFSKEFCYIPKHFAYPYGMMPENRQEMELFLKEMGFRSALTTYEGVLGKYTMQSPYAIPRIMVSELDHFSAHDAGREIAITNARAMLLGKRP